MNDDDSKMELMKLAQFIDEQLQKIIADDARFMILFHSKKGTGCTGTISASVAKIVLRQIEDSGELLGYDIDNVTEH